VSEAVKNKKRSELKEWILSFVIVVAVAVIVRTFLVCPIAVKGVSMEPNFHHGDYVLVNRFEYMISQPEKDDIIVCEYPGSKDEQKIIKRVIGIPGDTIDFEWTGEYYCLVLNGEYYEEEYINGDMYHLGDMDFPYTVQEGEYFVMGDNRNDSLDSRYKMVGAIEKSDMIGRVFISLKPFKKIN